MNIAILKKTDVSMFKLKCCVHLIPNIEHNTAPFYEYPCFMGLDKWNLVILTLETLLA